MKDPDQFCVDTIRTLSMDALPTLDRAKYASASGVARGAYVLAQPDQVTAAAREQLGRA